MAFRMNALPFGSSRSVHSFLRVSHSLWYLGVAMFDMLWCNYFDDFPTLTLRSESDSVMSTVHVLFGLLGWRFDRDGAKAHPFASAVQALGVMLDVSALHVSKAVFHNTAARVAEVVSCIDNALSSRCLSSIEALKLRGRLQFASGQLFGRISKAALAVVTEHAYLARAAYFPTTTLLS